MTESLVPSNLDLTDFPFMPFEFDRLFQSETWVLSNDAEKVAALTLWGRSWREVPAGSLPKDDRMLAHLSGAGTRWKRLKPMALRGWIDCGDGRLYHPVVSEKALEAWIEKLTSRIVGGVGNAKRWGTDFDPEPLIAEVVAARGMLKALNPDSRTLRKPIPKGQKSDPAGNPNGTPKSIPSGSQETGTGTVKAKADLSHAEGSSPTDAGRACLLMREAGCTSTNPSHPDLLAALAEGLTPEALADTAREAIDSQKPKPFAWAIATARGRHAEGAKPVTGATRGTDQPRESLADRNARRAAEILSRTGTG